MPAQVSPEIRRLAFPTRGGETGIEDAWIRRDFRKTQLSRVDNPTTRIPLMMAKGPPEEFYVELTEPLGAEFNVLKAHRAITAEDQSRRTRRQEEPTGYNTMWQLSET